MKRLISTILCIAVLCVGTVGIGEQNAFAAESFSGKVTGTYRDNGLKKVLKKTFNYTDSFFSDSSSKLNPELAKISALAAATTYNHDSAVAFMKECKFSAKYFTNKVSRKNNDKVSYIVGLKKVNGYTVVAVWIKGTSANYEWISNFNLGTKKVHQGFAKAEKAMRKKIDKYLKKKNVSGKVKFWITGHSRGAAVANIYSKKMSDKYGRTNVYAYTFASPRVASNVSGKKYKNIRNYINPGDFVTEIAPAKWNYKRYGKDIVFKNRKAFMKEFKNYTGIDYEGYTKSERNELINAFVKYCGSGVNDYYKKKTTTNTTPADFFLNGLALALHNDSSPRMEGLMYVADISSKDADAKDIFDKMIIGGATDNGFRHSHCPTGYICWLESTY